ncbi:small integral membrane protein 12-A [Chrysoperla carnea]|uniref:small integral membrane protein 12-A n=1 Tax=Chrysoperla carnea TaxID=189513 RepID=UPI001D093D87|nr:small integral membrane protein 12-A [Chrysoperla carnea]
MFWSVIVRYATRYAPFITVPFAGIIGYIGYNLEELISDKYTPFSESIQQKRMERLTTDEKLEDTLNTGKSKSKVAQSNSVLDTNLSPSLQAKRKEQLN